jgi:hypothetical protein
LKFNWAETEANQNVNSSVPTSFDYDYLISLIPEELGTPPQAPDGSIKNDKISFFKLQQLLQLSATELTRFAWPEDRKFDAL